MAVVRTPTVPNPQAVVVSPADGEFLHFRLEAAGPAPLFTFASSIDGVLFEAPDFPGHPKTVYEWEHLRNPLVLQPFELLDLGLAFLPSERYRYLVELRKPGAPSITVMDISYTGLPTDTTTEGVTVVIQ